MTDETPRRRATATRGGSRPTRATAVLIAAIAAVVLGSAAVAMMFVEQDMLHLPHIGFFGDPEPTVDAAGQRAALAEEKLRKELADELAAEKRTAERNHAEHLRYLDSYRAAVQRGDFDAAIVVMREALSRDSSKVSRAMAGGLSWRLATAAIEGGYTDEACELAADFLTGTDASSPEADTLEDDPIPRMLRLLAEGRRITNVRWQAGVQAWLGRFSDLPTESTRAHSLWPMGYARAVSGPAEATLAVAELDPLVPLPASFEGSLVSADIGRAFLQAGDLPRARTWLQRATANDDGLAYHPLAAVRARLDLALVDELQDRTADACSRYREVLARWPAPKPRSVTVDKARARMQALGCEQHPFQRPPDVL